MNSPHPRCALRCGRAQRFLTVRPRRVAPPSRISTRWSRRHKIGTHPCAGYHQRVASHRNEREALGRERRAYGMHGLAWSSFATGDDVSASSISTTRSGVCLRRGTGGATASRLSVRTGQPEAQALVSALMPTTSHGAIACYAVRSCRRSSTPHGDPIRGAAMRLAIINRRSTATSTCARWPSGVSVCSWLRLAGQMTPDRDSRSACAARSTNPGRPSTTAASTRTTSRAPTASSSAATTPARARHLAEAGP